MQVEVDKAFACISTMLHVHVIDPDLNEYKEDAFEALRTIRKEIERLEEIEWMYEGLTR
jgi:hypothetical protein